MNELAPDVRTDLRRFLHSAPGVMLMSFLHANPPTPPVHPGSDMQQHHVQVNYGFGLGNKATLDQLNKLAEDVEPPPEDEEEPRLVDTRLL